MRSPICVLVALLATIPSLPSAAWAAADQPRVAVLPIGGDAGKDVQKAIGKVVSRHGYRLVSTEQFRASAARLASTVEGAEVVRAVAADLGLVAVVMGKVTVVKKKRTVVIMVRDGSDGEVAEQATFAGRTRHALARAVEKGMWKKLGKSFRTGPAGPTTKSSTEVKSPTDDDPFSTAPKTPARTPAAEKPPAEVASAKEPDEVVVRKPARPPAREEAEEEPAAAAVAFPRFELSVSPHMLYRKFTYASDPQDDLSEYRTRIPGPAVAVSVAGFLPLAFPRLGLMISLEQAAALPSTTSAGFEYRSFSGDYLASAIVGLPTRYLIADLDVGGGRQRYALEPQGDAISRPRPIPNVTYDYLRAGLTLHVLTGTPFGIFAGGHYRHVLSPGLIRSAEWFESATVWGAEGNVGVSYRLLSWLEARAEGQLRMYKFRMDPGAGDAHVTDGATDQYFTAGLSLAVLLGGGADKR
jgi:hypothetical protein